MKDNDIRPMFAANFLHEENARAEVIFRIGSNMARSFLITSGLPYKYWPLMYRHAFWIMNRLPTANRN